MKTFVLASLALLASGCSVAVSSDVEAGPSKTCNIGRDYTVMYRGELPESVELAVQRAGFKKLNKLMNTYDSAGELSGRIYGQSLQVEINLNHRTISVRDFSTHESRSTSLSNCF